MNLTIRLAALCLAWNFVHVCARAEPADTTRADADVADNGSDSAQVRDALLRARVRFDEADYRAAAIEYERAYSALSAGPRRNAVLSNLALCYERLFAYDDAVVAYERYLREAAPSAEEGAEVARIVRGLRDLLGGLHVTSNVPAAVWIDERERGNAPLDLALAAGRHVLELRAPGHRNERRSVLIVPRTAQTLDVALPSERRYQGAHRGYFYGGLGLTGAALVTGAALGISALRAHDDAQTRAHAGLATRADEDHIRHLTTSADIAFGSAALFGVSSLVLLFLTDWDRADERADDRHARTVGFAIAPNLRGTGGTLLLRGAL